jgi:hypothetical protein
MSEPYTERAAFEAWILHTHGKYALDDEFTGAAWDAWQARAQRQPSDAALWGAYAEGRADEAENALSIDTTLREIWRALLTSGNHLQARQVRLAAEALRAANAATETVSAKA